MNGEGYEVKGLMWKPNGKRESFHKEFKTRKAMVDWTNKQAAKGNELTDLAYREPSR